MKQVHYRNIGYPKTGTTWLYWQFVDNPYIDGQVDLHNKEYTSNSLEKYKELYKDYNISYNLDTHLFIKTVKANAYNSPQNIHNHTTHISFSFRNLYEVLNSMYNMEKSRNPNFKDTQKVFINKFLTLYCDTKEIFNNWKQCRLPIKYMFYDDLCNNEEKYMHDICDYIGIPQFHSKRVGIKLKTDVTEKVIFDDDKMIKYINEGISVIEDNTKRDLTHWKK